MSSSGWYYRTNCGCCRQSTVWTSSETSIQRTIQMPLSRQQVIRHFLTKTKNKNKKLSGITSENRRTNTTCADWRKVSAWWPCVALWILWTKTDSISHPSVWMCYITINSTGVLHSMTYLLFSSTPSKDTKSNNFLTCPPCSFSMICLFTYSNLNKVSIIC